MTIPSKNFSKMLEKLLQLTGSLSRTPANSEAVEPWNSELLKKPRKPSKRMVKLFWKDQSRLSSLTLPLADAMIVEVTEEDAVDVVDVAKTEEGPDVHLLKNLKVATLFSLET